MNGDLTMLYAFFIETLATLGLLLWIAVLTAQNHRLKGDLERRERWHEKEQRRLRQDLDGPYTT